MILTGICNDNFVIWLHSNCDRFSNYNFFKLDLVMQYSIITEYLDDEDICIHVQPSFAIGFYKPDFYICGINDISYRKRFNSRKEAIEFAIFKANEIYNNKLKHYG